MDLQRLLEERVLSQDTFDWIQPLLEKEQNETRNRAEEEAANSQVLFSLPRRSDENESDDDDSSLEMQHLCLSGVCFLYNCDENARGHGNVVWGASLAMCLYLETLTTTRTTATPIESSRLSRYWHVLELGAGTAIPSIFLANVLARDRTLQAEKPLIHITDARRFHNIKPLLCAVGLQTIDVRHNVHLKVSPHSWGEGVHVTSDDSFLRLECGGSNSYDLVIVSDCIYNPEHHGHLLDSICGTLKKPTVADVKDKGGTALVSFSLHGNCPEEHVWAFFDKANMRQLAVRAVADHVEGRGWNMEETMKELGLWRVKMDPSRWIVFIYELKWASIDA